MGLSGSASLSQDRRATGTDKILDRILILTGAGVSAESGLGTFRDTDGLWSEYSLEDVATPEGYARDPARVHRFYNARRRNCLDAEPNAAHLAIARLEATLGEAVTVVTQNIDNLHERAGSRRVIHMHGEIMRALCASCGHSWDAPPVMGPDTACPHCGSHTARPDVVWFGEIPYDMANIGVLLSQADLFVALGTSGTVYPAAGFAAEAKAHGARTLELNLEASDATPLFDEFRLGNATQIVPEWVTEILSM